jgi:outer membrane biosynthesis protein TonB
MGLDESAVEAAKQWRFRPGRKDDKPITMAITIEVSYRLDRRDRDEPCPAQRDNTTV